MNKSRTLGIVITLSIAMVGSTIVDFYDAQHLEAAKSDLAFLWCYSTPISPNDFLCYTNHEECIMIQTVDDDEKSDCIRKKNGS